MDFAMPRWHLTAQACQIQTETLPKIGLRFSDVQIDLQKDYEKSMHRLPGAWTSRLNRCVPAMRHSARR
jgi:hypothetical protein